MAPRANWKGYLKLSLVSCAVALYPASSTSTRVAFNTINRKTGNRVKRIYIDPESGEEVDSADQVKGYAVAKGQYVLVEDEELDDVKIESSRTIDIEKFVPRAQIDPRYMDTPYYIAPEDKVSQDAFAVIREAMRDGNVVGLGRVVVSRRERIIMLEPFERGLLGTILRYGYEVRDAAAYFDEIPTIALADEMKDLADVIIKRKSGEFDATQFNDRYEDAIIELVKSKQTGGVVHANTNSPNPGTVINLMDALRRSLGDPAPAAKGDKKVKTSTEAVPAKPAALSKSKGKVEPVPSKRVAGKKGK